MTHKRGAGKLSGSAHFLYMSEFPCQPYQEYDAPEG